MKGTAFIQDKLSNAREGRGCEAQAHTRATVELPRPFWRVSEVGGP